MTRRIVAIVGSAPATREMANLEPPEVEVWGLNDAYKVLKRWSRWFEMHPLGKNELYLYEDVGHQQQHFDFLQSCGVPVYQLSPDPRLPTSVPFPVHEIGSRFRHYWVDTITFMLSLAVYERVDEIHLWGVEMAAYTKYAEKRPCCEYWLGVAEALGITVMVPESSPLLKTPRGLYGFSPTDREIDLATIKDDIAAVDARIRNAQANSQRTIFLQQMGARQALVRMLHRADPTTIGKPVLSAVVQTIERNGERIEVVAVVQTIERNGERIEVVPVRD